MKRFDTLQEIIEQLEMPNYQTKDGLHELKDNAAFAQLKVEGCPSSKKIIEELKMISNNYQVLEGQYVISKNVLDVFIEHVDSHLNAL
jgi:hypothetical protein